VVGVVASLWWYTQGVVGVCSSLWWYTQGVVGVYPICHPGYVPGIHHPVYTLLYIPGYTLHQCTPGYTVTLMRGAGRRSPGLKVGDMPG